MAYQTSSIRYRGSFKSIRNYQNAHDPKVYAGEKGGANRDLIMNNPAFARTRENMSEFKGCGMAVKAIRQGLTGVVQEHTDTRFTGRLVSLVKMINLKDTEGVRGFRAITFSQNRPLLKSVTFHEKKKIDYELRKFIRTSHPDSRAEATMTVTGLNPNPQTFPGNAEAYRVFNLISIISDYGYNGEVKKYEPSSSLNSTNVLVYSDYTPVNTPLTAEVKATFPEETVLTESDTVLQCIGIEFYLRSGKEGYRRYPGGSMMVYDVF
jgi:hypothetical protein